MLRNHRSRRNDDWDRAVDAQYFDAASKCNTLRFRLDDAVEHLEYLRCGRITDDDLELFFENFQDLVEACPTIGELTLERCEIFKVTESENLFYLGFMFGLRSGLEKIIISMIIISMKASHV